MPENSVILGFAAPPLKEQHPALSQADADHFDADNVAISRLKIRGMIAPSVADKARAKLVKQIETALRRALKQ